MSLFSRFFKQTNDNEQKKEAAQQQLQTIVHRTISFSYYMARDFADLDNCNDDDPAPHMLFFSLFPRLVAFYTLQASTFLKTTSLIHYVNLDFEHAFDDIPHSLYSTAQQDLIETYDRFVDHYNSAPPRASSAFDTWQYRCCRDITNTCMLPDPVTATLELFSSASGFIEFLNKENPNA